MRQGAAARARRAAWLALLGCAAIASCDRADDAPSSPSESAAAGLRPDAVPPQSTAPNTPDSEASAIDAGSVPGADCPAPRASSTTGLVPVWARNPDTAGCCAYDSQLAAPSTWPAFPSETECESSCRCSTLDDVDGDGVSGTERTPLDCRCASGDCPATVADAEQSLCALPTLDVLGFSVERREGCGRVYVSSSNGFFGNAWVFSGGAAGAGASPSSPQLVGAFAFTDAPSSPCQTYTWVAGQAFECDDIVACQVCGTPLGAPLPDCE